MNYTIRDLTETDIQKAAQVAYLAFKTHFPNWFTTVDVAAGEVRESLEEGKISRVALAENGAIIGWTGAHQMYDNYVWELHPLAVHPDYHGHGIGRALVLDLEAQVKARGGKSMMLGTDDEDGQTSLWGIDLYPNVWEHIQKIENLNGHSYSFYQKMGYAIIGVVPDANGWGKPDILMAKRLS